MASILTSFLVGFALGVFAGEHRRNVGLEAARDAAERFGFAEHRLRVEAERRLLSRTHSNCPCEGRDAR